MISTKYHILFFTISLLVFAQKRSNSVLTALIALAFYIYCYVSIVIFTYRGWDKFGYTLATRHPVLTLPVFTMGVLAGVLCNRIQQGDFDSFQRMYTQNVRVTQTKVPDFVFLLIFTSSRKACFGVCCFFLNEQIECQKFWEDPQALGKNKKRIEKLKKKRFHLLNFFLA